MADWTTGDFALAGVGVLTVLGVGYVVAHNRLHQLQYDDLRSRFDPNSAGDSNLWFGYGQKEQKQIQRFVIEPFLERHGLLSDTLSLGER